MAALFTLALGAALAASAPAAVSVQIVEPPGGAPVFDRIKVRATVSSDAPVREVMLYLDGRLSGRLEPPEYAMTVDVGGENEPHHFRVVATTDSGSIGEATLSTPAIKVDEEVSVELQQVYVTATEEGQRVLDLGPADFEVLDNGEPQRLISFARGDIPFTAVILVDASWSMTGRKLDTALAGAKAFVSGMQPLDEGKIIGFSDRIDFVSPFSGSSQILTADLGRIEARGGTAINDILFLAVKLLDERQGRRTVVMLTDGVDVHSALRMRETAMAIRRSPAMVYWIRLVRPSAASGDTAGVKRITSTWRDAEEHREEMQELERAVAESGGRIVRAAFDTDIAPAFAEVLRELREQYVLGYYPSRLAHDGSWHRVDVRIRKPGVVARTRGYIDY